MANETPESTEAGTEETHRPESPATGTEETHGPESPAAGAQETHRPRTIRIGRRKLAIAAGSVAIFAAGTLLGIGLTHHAYAIPSAAAATNSRTEPPAADTSEPGDTGSAEWNPLRDLRNMQLNMDRMFDRMTTHYGHQARQRALADNPGYSLSLRLKDVDDHYEVRARLPDAKASDVKVSLLDDQTLKVDVSDRSNESENTKGSNVSSDITEWDHYDEVIALPGPVKSEQMKVDRANHELLVTLPKA